MYHVVFVGHQQLLFFLKVVPVAENRRASQSVAASRSDGYVMVQAIRICIWPVSPAISSSYVAWYMGYGLNWFGVSAV